VNVAVAVAVAVGVGVGVNVAVGVGLGVGVPAVKLLAFRKTAESRKPSLASAIASFMWFATPGVTLAVQVRTTVRPSICILIVTVGRTLSLKNSG
jgi:hypothetical protein